MVFKNWWDDDFASDLYYENKEELMEFSDDDYDTVKNDWIACMMNDYSFLGWVCEKLGVDVYNIDSPLHQRFVEELYDIVKDALFVRLDKELDRERSCVAM